MTLQYFFLMLISELIATTLVAWFAYFFIEKKQRIERENLDLRLHSHMDKMDNHISTVEANLLKILHKK